MQIQRLPPQATKVLSLLETSEARLHFSQCGEDAVLWHYFHARQAGFYVDVGCHHPWRFSNTALLAAFNGWSGINIDLDERAIQAFREARPHDTNVQSAVGPESASARVTIFVDGAVNSLDSAFADHQAAIRPVADSRTIPVRSLASLLEEYLPPGQSIDFLNVDAEGWDQPVLESNDWDRFRPEMLAVESHGFDLNDPSANATFRFLRSRGYSLISHVVVTSIYIRQT